jgi:hypothetical protein
MAGKKSTGKPKRGPGNPRILEQNEPYRFPAISPGEKSVTVSLRIPQSKLERLDNLGKRADVIREAIDLLLTQSEAPTTVWLLLENNPGVRNRVLGMFSSPALAMKAPGISQVIGVGTWEEKTSGVWICKSFSDSDFYFSVESWQVVR